MQIAPEFLAQMTRLLAWLSELPPWDLDDGVERLTERIVAMTGGDDVCYLFARRPEGANPSGVLKGFQVAHVCWPSLDPARMQIIAEWQRDTQSIKDDPTNQVFMERAGENRAFLHDELIDRETWEASKEYDLLLRLGVLDRMRAASALTPDLELIVCLDRKLGGVPFEASQRNLTRAIVEGLGPFGRSWARTMGFLDATAPLSPREQETLGKLLRGDSEQEIAEQMSIARSTAHQYVVSIYRKFRVSSRAELAALWLGDQTA